MSTYFSDEDYEIEYAEPFESVKEELLQVSKILQEWLPDPSIGPEERLERLARIVPKSLLKTQHRLNARTKLTYLRNRLNELCNNDDSSVEQLYQLKEMVDRAVSEEMSLFKKLESIGDFRGADVGFYPRIYPK